MLRSREFVMKDAYSFDSSEEGLEESYWNMFRAYQSVFKRCGLDFRAVEADAGAIGGKGGTHEFMALSDVGEDTIAYSDASILRPILKWQRLQTVMKSRPGRKRPWRRWIPRR